MTLMEPTPSAPKPAEKAPRTERVTQALERVGELAKEVTGRVIGFKVDQYNTRGYGKVEFFEANQETAEATRDSQPGVSIVYDDMVYGDSSADLDGDHGNQYFIGVPTASFERINRSADGAREASARFTVFGEEVTEAEFQDFVAAERQTILDTLKKEKPEVRYQGTNRTYREIDTDTR